MCADVPVIGATGARLGMLICGTRWPEIPDLLAEFDGIPVVQISRLVQLGVAAPRGVGPTPRSRIIHVPSSRACSKCVWGAQLIMSYAGRLSVASSTK